MQIHSSKGNVQWDYPPNREGKASCYWSWEVYFDSFQHSIIISALQNVKQFLRLYSVTCLLILQYLDQGWMSWHFPEWKLSSLYQFPSSNTNNKWLCTLYTTTEVLRKESRAFKSLFFQNWISPQQHPHSVKDYQNSIASLPYCSLPSS